MLPLCAIQQRHAPDRESAFLPSSTRMVSRLNARRVMPGAIAVFTRAQLSALSVGLARSNKLRNTPPSPVRTRSKTAIDHYSDS